MSLNTIKIMLDANFSQPMSIVRAFFSREVSLLNFEPVYGYWPKSKLLGEDIMSQKRLRISNSAFMNFQIPIGFCEVFFWIENLTIERSNLMNISKEHLRFANLKTLNLDGNRLEFLPGDLFKYSCNLTSISFNNNRIKFIGAELLDELEYLEEASFEKNVAINYKAPKNEFDELKRLIRKNCADGAVPNQVRRASTDITFQSSFLKELNAHLARDDFKDFTIKIEQREFKVHKVIFAARSEIFADLIRNNPDVTELVLTDISAEIFESILKFIYTDEIPKDPKNIRKVLFAASKLKIQKLKEISAKILDNQMKTATLESLMENLELGIGLDSEHIKRAAFEEMKKHFPGKKLKEELLDEPDKLKVLVEAKKIQDEFME